MLSMTWVDYECCTCSINNQRVKLTKQLTEFLFYLLVNHPDKFIHKEELISFIYPHPDFEPEWAENCISIMIAKLRKRGIYIETYYGIGYRIPRQTRH